METILAPHHDLSYEQRHISEFKDFDWSKATKWDAVSFARASGFKETGMSANEVALLFDLLEAKKPKPIVELGRNYGTSTRLFLQHVIRHGGYLESWDLKHWDGFLEIMDANGYPFFCFYGNEYVDIKSGAPHSPKIRIKVAHSIKTAIPEDFKVDFLLIDTEHAMENAVSEYLRWREYLNSGALIAFHDSTLLAVSRSIEIILEIEDKCRPGRIDKIHKNEREDGFGICVLEWKG